MKKEEQIKRDEFIQNLMNQMTLDEKIGQLYESPYFGGFITGPEFEANDVNILIKEGRIGSIIGLYDNRVIYNLQKSAVENSRLHIPLFFANDIIHGCRTIFPIPLAIACSFNPDLAFSCAKVSAIEGSHSGVNVVFSPMVDLVRDPRWGRVMESFGEDPYLAGVFSRSFVEGYQGKNKSSENSVGCCLKHYLGYGAAIAGREYNSVDMSLDTMYNYYLPSFKEGIDAGASMVMSAFNTFNGIPATANKFLLQDVLRRRLKFKGVVISDYTSSAEIVKHKIAKDLRDVAYREIIAGLDHEMVSRAYLEHLKEFTSDAKVLKRIDESARRVLELKYDLGLFKDPYKAIRINFEDYWFKDEYKKAALAAADESICLLENRILPLNEDDKVLFIGPFLDTKRVIGAWGGKADKEDAKTLEDELSKTNYRYDLFKGCDFLADLRLDGIEEKIKSCDKIVVILGEDQWMSGENHSRTELSLPSVQDELLERLIKLNKSYNKPIILLIHAGRPLVLTKYKNYFDNNLLSAIGYLWFLGTMSSKAIIDTLWGKINPSGKLAMSFPYCVGQIPIYYNVLPTGRPKEEGKPDDYLTKYMDAPNEALYPFGYGLSYSKFIYEDVVLENNIMDDKLSFSVTIFNDSPRAGKEIVEVYIECLNDVVSRPVDELKAFKKELIEARSKKTIKFSLKRSDLNYYVDGKKHIALGDYGLKVGPNSRDTIVKYFKVI